MFTLEDKVNIILSYIAAPDAITRDEVKSLAVEAIQGISIPSEPSGSDHYTGKPTYDLDGLIADHLNKCGMPPHLFGYTYMITAIKLCLNDPELIHNITSGLYGDVASIHGTTASRTERALRHAIEAIFDRAGGLDYIEQVFGNVVNVNKGKLTNSEFIAASVNEIKRLMK